MSVDCLWALAGVVVLAILVVPLVVYMSVRMGTFGYLRARQQFDQYQKEDGHGA
jgi:hypothetical protein